MYLSLLCFLYFSCSCLGHCLIFSSYMAPFIFFSMLKFHYFLYNRFPVPHASPRSPCALPACPLKSSPAIILPVSSAFTPLSCFLRFFLLLTSHILLAPRTPHAPYTPHTTHTYSHLLTPTHTPLTPPTPNTPCFLFFLDPICCPSIESTQLLHRLKYFALFLESYIQISRIPDFHTSRVVLEAVKSEGGL